MEDTRVKSKHLYRVEYPGWDEPTFVAASDQQTALQIAYEDCSDGYGTDRDQMSVTYVSDILVEF